MRIVDAIMEVLKVEEGLTFKEVYKHIVKLGLYQFGAKDPENVVNNEIRRHCQGIDFPSASPVKYFKVTGQKNGKNLYGVLQNSLMDSKNVSIKNKFLSEIDLLPEEKIDLTYLLYKSSLKRQILDHLLESHPSFFERLVVDLLIEMGYGSDEFPGKVLGKSHDGGIDGVIYEDKLGLSKIYIQAKRNDRGNTIGRPLLQAFVGAIQDVQKGVFITTSSFTKEAKTYAEKQQQKSLKLIDGDLLAEFMIKYGIGLEKVRTYTVYKINEDYFE